jgi:hypothetical protein
MPSPAIDHTYRYLAPSVLEGERGGPRLKLATSGGVEEHPRFFSGVLARSRQSADLLLALALVARSRFHVPAAMLRLVAMSDPVVTSDGQRLRLESFSSCCGVYARADLLADTLEGEWLGRGTTNVDFNPPMRTALTRVADGERMGLSVGQDSVELESRGARVVERKVVLPIRWLRGFVEVQAYQARLEPRFEVGATEARRLLRAVPRQASRSASFLVPAGRGLRLSQRETKNAVQVGGVERLHLLEGLARHGTALRVFGDQAGETSAFVLELPGARFTLLLSADVWRGFSGEGQALSALARSKAEGLSAVRATLEKERQGVIDPGALARRSGLDAGETASALATLGARGIVGFDLHERSYFHRELPFDLDLVEAVQPRLKAARKLCAEDGVEILTSAEDRIEADVRGSGVKHRVRLTGDGFSCTCPWFSKHQGRRGPCKHVLAVQLATDEGAKQ